MTEIPGWETEIHPTIKAVIKLIGDRLPELRSTEFPHPRVMAAAYLARVRRLVIATEVLYESGMPDVVGVPLRVCFEAWVTGMWVVMIGQDATDILNADYPVQVNRWVKKAKLDNEHVPEIENIDKLPSVWDRTVAVAGALIKDGDSGASELRWAYSLTYIGESTVSIHAGFPAVIGHFEMGDDDEWFGAQLVRFEGGDGSGKLLWAVALLVMLAGRVFVKFGIGVDELDSLAEPVRRLAVELNEAAGK